VAVRRQMVNCVGGGGCSANRVLQLTIVPYDVCMCVCMCVCMYVLCTYECMYVLMYLCNLFHVFLLMYLRINNYACMYLHRYVRMYVCGHILI
jgi:hypothetical protein